MRKALAKNEAQLSRDQIEEEDRVRQRMEVIREFIENKAAKSAKPGKN
jgi:hypothetical protein